MKKLWSFVFTCAAAAVIGWLILLGLREPVVSMVLWSVILIIGCFLGLWAVIHNFLYRMDPW